MGAILFQAGLSAQKIIKKAPTRGALNNKSLYG